MRLNALVLGLVLFAGAAWAQDADTPRAKPPAVDPRPGRDPGARRLSPSQSSTPTATSAKNDRARAEPHGSDAEGEPSETTTPVRTRPASGEA